MMSYTVYKCFNVKVNMNFTYTKYFIHLKYLLYIHYNYTMYVIHTYTINNYKMYLSIFTKKKKKTMNKNSFTNF